MQQSTIDQFLSYVHLQMHSLMSRDFFTDAEISEDTAVLTFSLPTAYDIHDLLDMLDDRMELVILYHVVPTDAAVLGEQCCAYSDPTFEHIYKVNCITDDTGMCDTLYVTLYDSLETMGADVQSELDEQLSKSSEVVFSRPMREVLRDFMR